MVTARFASVSKALAIQYSNEQGRANGIRDDNRHVIVGNNTVVHPPPKHPYFSGTSGSRHVPKQEVSSKVSVADDTNVVSAEKQRKPIAKQAHKATAIERRETVNDDSRKKARQQYNTTSHKPMDESNNNGVTTPNEVALQSKLTALELACIEKDALIKQLKDDKADANGLLRFAKGEIDEKDNELEEKDNQLMEHQSTIQQQRQRTAKMEQDMKNQQRQHEEETQSLRHDNDILSRNHESMQDKLVENQTTLEEKEKNISRHSSRIDELKDKVEELQYSLSSQEERHTNRTSEALSEYKEINDKLQLDKKKHEVEMQRQSSNFVKQLAECEEINNKNKAEHKVDIEKLESRHKQETDKQLIESKNAIASIEQTHEVSMTAQEEKNKNITIELESVKAECNKQSSSINDLELKVDEMKTANEVVNDRNNLLSSVYDKKTSELTESRQLLSSYKDELNTEKANNEKLTHQVATLRMERDNLLEGESESRQRRQTENSKLKQKLIAEVGLGNQQNSLLSKLEVERRNMTSQLIQLQEENANLTKRIETNEFASLRLIEEQLTSSGLKHAIDKIKSSVDQSNIERQQAMRELQSSKEEVSILKTKKEDMESSHKAEMDTLQNKVSEEKNKYKESTLDNQRAREERRLHKESTTSTRVCFNCKNDLQKNLFSDTQWTRRGSKARCKNCVANDNKLTIDD